MASPLLSPGEQLSSPQPSGGILEQSVSVFPDISDIPGALLRNIEEIIHLGGDVPVPGHIHPFHFRDPGLVYPLVIAAVGLPGRDDEPSSRILRHCHIAPPVHGDHLIPRVDDPHPAVQRLSRFLKPEIHLILDPPDPLIFIHPKHRDPFFHGKSRRIKRPGGKRRVADQAHIPLHAPAEPGIAYGKIAETDHIIGIQKIPSGLLVCKFPQAAAQLRKKNGSQEVIFQYCRLHLPLSYFPPVSLDLGIGIRIGPSAESLIDLIVFLQGKFQMVLEHSFSPQVRDTGRFAKFPCPHDFCLESQLRFHKSLFSFAVFFILRKIPSVFQWRFSRSWKRKNERCPGSRQSPAGYILLHDRARSASSAPAAPGGSGPGR